MSSAALAASGIIAIAVPAIEAILVDNFIIPP
jgi:hypothetical protein